MLIIYARVLGLSLIHIYIRERTSASRDLVASLYSYLQRKETLNVPDESQVPNRVVDEEGEAEEGKRNGFGGSAQKDKNSSVNTELEDPKVTSQLNPDAAEFVPVSPSRFMTDPDPVTSSSPTPGDEKSLDGGALPLSLIHI